MVGTKRATGVGLASQLLPAELERPGSAGAAMPPNEPSEWLSPAPFDAERALVMTEPETLVAPNVLSPVVRLPKSALGRNWQGAGRGVSE